MNGLREMKQIVDMLNEVSSNSLPIYSAFFHKDFNKWQLNCTDFYLYMSEEFKESMNIIRDSLYNDFFCAYVHPTTILIIRDKNKVRKWISIGMK